MKVLFVRSGNRGIDPISTKQGLSLEKLGLKIVYYDIAGKGLLGYLNNLIKLKAFINKQKPDLIHAHFYFSGFLSALTFTGTPIITSLMGSDVLASGKLMLWLTRFFSRYFWDYTIVKSKEISSKLAVTKSTVIPNGVDLEDFYPVPRNVALEKLNWKSNIYHILFASDPSRPEKNFQLASQAIDLLTNQQVNSEIHFLKGIPSDEMILYYNAANVLLLTSFHEGSPNVIKEAMACNCSLVATNVGDIKEVVGSTRGCYLTGFDPGEIAEKLKLALSSENRTNGRDNMSKYNSNLIAEKIIAIYKTALINRKKR
jgi:glycosyltransferase involved in cell wall biosynthesis